MTKGTSSPNFNVRSFIIKICRANFRKCPLYRDAKEKAKEEFFETTKTGKQVRRVRFVCASCNGRFLDRPKQREIVVDHIDPVIDPNVGWVDYNTFIDRLFTDKLQVLCKECHAAKTKREKGQLAKTKRKKKEQ